MIIFTITISFMIGILWGLYLKISIIPFLLLLSVIILIIKKKTLIFFLIPCLIANTYLLKIENEFKTKYKDITGEVTIIGTIISNAEEKAYSYQYKLKVEKLSFLKNEQKQCKNTNILLKIKKEKDAKILNYGDKIVLKGEFELAETQRNYGRFNYRQYLKTKQIHGVVTAKHTQIKLIKQNNENIINILVNKTSLKIKEKINKVLPEKQSNLLTGILIGDKSSLSKDIQNDFKNSNLSHMLAISGAHVSYIILGFTIILNKVRVGKRLSKIVTIVFLIFFTILVGATPSVQRAAIMSIYILIGGLLYKKPNILISISLSMLILLIENPYNLFDVGFQLSYGGTIGIILLSKRIKFRASKLKIIQSIKQIMIVTLSANIIIIPIMMMNYNTISFTFLVSNILASPILGVIIILGFITILSPINIVLPKILEILLNILIFVADFSSKLPFSKIYVVTPTTLQVILYYFLIIIYLLKKKLFKVKALIVAYLVITLAFPNITIFPKTLKIHFIDVSQGDSTLITTPYGKNILIDGGGSKDSENFDVGENTLIPYLLDRRIAKIDFIFISHFDLDHVRTVY